MQKLDKTIKTEWDLTQFYKSPKDPQIQKDMDAYDVLCTNFEKKYKGKKVHLENERKLAKAIAEYELISNSVLISKPFFYFMLARDSRPDDDWTLVAGSNKVQESMTKSGNKLLFFTLDLGKVSETHKKKFLKSQILKEYRYFLKTLFNWSKYLLSEPEEKILELKSQPASDLWVGGLEKLLSKLVIPFDGKKLPIAKAASMVSELPVAKRRELHKTIYETLDGVSDFAESELNAFVINKKIDDELRGFKTPYAAKVLSNENDPAVIETLIRVVTDNFTISHRFYALKAKMMKLGTFTYADRAADIASNPKPISLEKTLELMQTMLSKMGDFYVDTFNRMLREGRIDIYPRKNKKGGAYSWRMKGLPGFVLLNHINNIPSVMTFAHEMGHAIHSELSSRQRTMYQGHVSSVAEVASTLFESFMFDQIFSSLTDEEKVIALHDKIQDDIQTIFRQIAGFNFENDLHLKIREKGALSKEDIAKLMVHHMHTYLGPKFKLTPLDGNNFINWAHLRMNFYVYTYAYGQITSKALYAEYKKDPKFFQKIEEFLKAGRSKSPEDIFLDTGINIRNPKFFLTGLKAIEKDIDMLEQLLKKKK